MRREYYKTSGRFPERILISSSVADRIRKEIEEETGYTPIKGGKLFGMTIEIEGEEDEKDLHG